MIYSESAANAVNSIIPKYQWFLLLNKQPEACIRASSLIIKSQRLLVQRIWMCVCEKRGRKGGVDWGDVGREIVQAVSAQVIFLTNIGWRTGLVEVRLGRES